MMRVLFQAGCPACWRRIRGPTEEVYTARMVRHLRNCGALRADVRRADLQVEPTPEPTP